MDVECFRNTEAFLENFDMVFNIETAEGSVVTNAVMASVPNAAIWQCVFENLQVRKYILTPGQGLMSASLPAAKGPASEISALPLNC